MKETPMCIQYGRVWFTFSQPDSETTHILDPAVESGPLETVQKNVVPTLFGILG
jgi:hypothetical protein